MSRRVAVVLAAISCLGSPVLAGVQRALPVDPPLVNWTAPSTWMPPAANAVRPHLGDAGGVNHGVSALGTGQATGLPFTAVTPCRLVDTRHSPHKDLDEPGDVTPSGFPRGQYASGETRSYDLPTSTNCPGLPTGVGAWSLMFQFTTMGSSGVPSFLVAWPYSSSGGIGGQTAPSGEATMLGYADRWTADSAVIPAGDDAAGSINVYTENAGDVIVEINGYYAASTVVTTADLIRIGELNWWGGPRSGGGYGFDSPGGVAFDGARIWVANQAGNSVTAINASDGSWVRTLSGGSYGFNSPSGVAFDGVHVWVTNLLGNSVTEINAGDGSWAQTLSGGSYGFSFPAGLAFDGAHIWVANLDGGSVTEINASDGGWVRTVSIGSFAFTAPSNVVFDGAHIWVVDNRGNSATEIAVADGSLVRTLSDASYGFSSPTGIAFDGTRVWVVNPNGNSVTEISGTDGSLVQTLSGGSYGFNRPSAVAFDGAHIWVANAGGDSVTEINATNGSCVQTFFGSTYGLSLPRGLAFDGTRIWATNGTGNSVTEILAR